MSKRVILVSHCLLNIHAKVIGSGVTSDVGSFIISSLLSHGFGLIQLPCPELTHGGLWRWGQSRSQYDNAFFKSHCTKLTKDVVNQVEEYLRCDYLVGPVIGINGSPSCGIDFCYDGLWGGEIGDIQKLPDKIENLSCTNCMGVFMEVLKEQLENRKILIDWVGVNEEEPESSLSRLFELIGLKQKRRLVVYE